MLRHCLKCQEEIKFRVFVDFFRISWIVGIAIMQQNVTLDISESVHLAFAILSSGYIHEMEGGNLAHLSDATLIKEGSTDSDQ
jgi:hypothetical protein